MSIQIKTSNNSFIRFIDQHIDIVNYYETQVDGAEIGYCVPVYGANELRFQFSVTGTESEIDYVCGLDPGGNIQFCVVSGSPTTTVPTLPGLTLQPWNLEDLFFQKFRVFDTEVVFVLQTPVDMFDFIPCDTCFQMVLFFELPPVVGQPTAYVNAISNCLKRICSTEFTSLVEYSADADTAGFYYCSGVNVTNRVRVPMYFSKPVFTEDSAMYKDSKGAISITRMQVAKQYPVKTDYLPEWVHECVRAVFVHDNITVSSGRYSGKISLNGSYEIDWPANEYPAAIATFKADVTPFLLKNNNCGDCASLAYGIVASNYTVPGLSLPSHTYTVNLATLVSSPCCSPVSYHVVSTNATVVHSIALSAGGVLTISTNPSVPGGVGYNAITFNATCGAGVSNNANIQMVF